MSLLWDHAQRIAVTFTLRHDGNVGGEDVVLLSRGLWDSMTQGSQDIRRLLLLISPNTRQHRLARSVPPLSLVCWAVPNDEASGLEIPPSWLKTDKDIFEAASRSHSDPEVTLFISVTTLVPLSDVVISVSPSLYSSMQRSVPPIRQWLSDKSILRQGVAYYPSTHLLPPSDEEFTSAAVGYTLASLAPVAQGCADEHTTQFIVLARTSSVDNEEDIDGTDELESHTIVDGIDNQIEIDEGFLASSVLPHMQDSPSRSPQSFVSSGTKATHTQTQGYPREVKFCPKSLQHPVSLEDDCTLYVNTSYLGRIGVLNNEWAVVRPSDTAMYRLVRVVANDSLVSKRESMLASPVLLHNIYGGAIMSSERPLLLSPSPFGSADPSIPLAQSLTVARIASPLVVDRRYQPLCIDALQHYLSRKRRVLKRGDVIAVGVDVNHSVHAYSDDEIVDCAEFGPSAFGPAISINEVAFFLITNIEYDLPSIVDDTGMDDAYTGSSAGELGCWMDSNVTRVVQSAVEHARVPPVLGYMTSEKHNCAALLHRLEQQHPAQLLREEGPFGRLFSLSSAALHKRASEYDIHLSVLLSGSHGTGKLTTASWIAQRLCMHLLEINCFDIIGEPTVKVEAMIRSRFEKASSCSPCILVLRHVDALVQETRISEGRYESTVESILEECMVDLEKSWKMTGFPVIVFGTTDDVSRLPPLFMSIFKHEIHFEVPDDVERQEILATLLSDESVAYDVSVAYLANQTAGLVAKDLVELVRCAKCASRKRVRGCLDADPHVLEDSGINLTVADFDAALENVRLSYAQSIGAPSIPDVSWDDVGGLADVKSEILDTIQLPIEHPELFGVSLKKRSGILLYGPPGTGKTLLAKAVATSCSLNFFSVKGPELLNMYIGESEANVRRVFQRARDARPCVIFFDELDSVAPKRGNHGDSGGVMDRIVSQLLAELDGISASTGGADVFVIGATNRPDLLDPALLRPGRFDRMLYLGVSRTHQAQLDILEALTRKFCLDPSLNLRRIAERCPFHYTGADLYALCADALLKAMSRKAENVEMRIAEINQAGGIKGHPFPVSPQYYLAELASESDVEVTVSDQDFTVALESLVPSVTEVEMSHYSVIQAKFASKSLET